jgi:dihydrofolate reductase
MRLGLIRSSSMRASLASALSWAAGIRTRRRRHGVATNPFGAPFFIVTHRTEDAPPAGGFNVVNGVDEAIAQARKAAEGKDVFVMGGADVIRQALRAGFVEELSISIAPVVLGGGKRLFDDFDETVSLEHLRLLQSPFATHITYRVVR